MFTTQFLYVSFGVIRIELEYCIFIFCSKLFENLFPGVINLNIQQLLHDKVIQLSNIIFT
jgi:hypothetical protein